MFKKLRIKFIAITMVMVALVMALAFAAACFSEYQRSMSVVNTALSDAVDNAISIADRGKHKFDDGRVPRELRSMGSSGSPSGQDAGSGTDAGEGSEAGSSSASASDPAYVPDAGSAGVEPGRVEEGVRSAVEDAVAQVISPQCAYAAEGGGQGDDSRTGGEQASRASQGQGQQRQSPQTQEKPGQAGAQGQSSQSGQQSQAGADQAGDQPSGSQGLVDSAADFDRASVGGPARDANEPAPENAPDAEERQEPPEQAPDNDDDDDDAENQDASREGVSAQEPQAEARSDAASQAGEPEGDPDAASPEPAQAAQESTGGAGGTGGQISGEDASSPSDDSITFEDDGQGATAPPTIGFRGGGQRATSTIVPVAVYSVSASGTMRAVPEVTTASLTQDVLLEAAELANAGAEGYSAYPDLSLYGLKKQEGDTAYLAFADMTYTDSWKSLAMVLVAAGAGTLVVFFIICLFYSNWALRPVREAWDSQRQFVADASHDLKTPLTVILANASILLKHPEHTIASESQWVESTQKEAEDMQGLVNEMLELAQIEAGHEIETAREPIDFSDLVDGETLMFDSVALERSCAFECSLEGGIAVSGDGKQVKKLVSTLVENAFKYVEEGGAVDIELKREGNNAVLAIRNSGSVISEEDLPHIFDRFYRTDKARTSGTGGFGLGLAIAREIAVRHGGDITCASNERSGTTFTVTLPVL